MNGISKRVVFALLAAHVFFPILWIVVLAHNGPQQNDWREFQVAAEQFVSGAWHELYSPRLDSIHPGYLWLYPPYALYLISPLASLSPSAAYAVIAGVGVIALAGSLLMLRRLTVIPETPGWVLAIALSAPALATVITGQVTALVLTCIVGAAALWTNGWPVAAGALLGFLALKPNIGIFFGLYLIVRRQWRELAAMLAVVAGLCISTLPLGFGLWSAFIRISLRRIDLLSQHESYKLITLKAFLEKILGDTAFVDGIWLILVVGLVAMAARAWREPGSPLRHMALVTLVAVAVNPYGFFYDALLLVLPATLWWSEQEIWRPRRWMLVAFLITLAWCWEQYSFAWREVLRFARLDPAPPFSVIGPVSALWLIIASAEAIRASGEEKTLHTERLPETRVIAENSASRAREAIRSR